jgi:hypothetical protein
MKIFVLETDLFPQTQLVDELVTQLETRCSVYRYDARQPDLTDDDWDRAVVQLMATDHALTI